MPRTLPPTSPPMTLPSGPLLSCGSPLCLLSPGRPGPARPLLSEKYGMVLPLIWTSLQSPSREWRKVFKVRMIMMCCTEHVVHDKKQWSWICFACVAPHGILVYVVDGKRVSRVTMRTWLVLACVPCSCRGPFPSFFCCRCPYICIFFCNKCHRLGDHFSRAALSNVLRYDILLRR